MPQAARVDFLARRLADDFVAFIDHIKDFVCHNSLHCGNNPGWKAMSDSFLLGEQRAGWLNFQPTR
jgi:hypothetical protein